ncbi:retrotransposon protein, putative, ty1-copia subclass [Tanacetum coccineum]
MFEKPPAVEIYDLVDTLHSCKQAPGKSVSAHVLEMKGYMDQLQALGKPYDNDMAINLINRSLNKDFGDFVRNFNIADAREDKEGKSKEGSSLSPLQRSWSLEEELPSLPQELRTEMNNKMAESRCPGKHQEVELQLGKKIKALRSDRGGEYLSQEFKDYLSENGIVQNLTSPYTPQQNGVSERRNRTLLDMVRSMFNLTTLPLSFWDYALESAVRILNMVPTKKVDKTPYEIWHGKAPNLSYLKVWGCEAYVKRDSADKLQQRSVKCIFVGYPKETMGYYFYFPPENKVIVARYGDFLERDLISQEFSGRDYDLEDDHMDTLPSENTSEIPVEPESLGPPSELIPVRRSERTKRAPNRLCLNMEVEDDVVGDLGEPANYKTAMLDPDKVIWQGAMDEEMNSMKVNEVWTEVDPPPNAKIVRSKWIFKKKTDMDGKVHTYKARLVAKGCTQTYGVDYEETFSPVADIRAIRILIAIAAYYDYEIWQMDVKTAFLNGRLDEDIYMEQPEGYVNPKYPNRVCKLQRSIYGLKQASRQWNKRFDEEIKKFGFTQNRDEPCVYRKASGSNVVFLILYVDDILIMGNNIPRLKEVKDYLGKCFSMKDLGEAAYILGIKIYRDRSKRLIGLSQSAYIDKILKKFNMHNSKKGYLPMEVKHELSNEMCASTPEEVAYMKKVPYASAVGSIMYAVRCTRPDVAFAQNLASRYQQNPGKLHWVAVKHILKYLRNTRDMFLVYGGKPDTELNVTGFCDASWQSNKNESQELTDSHEAFADMKKESLLLCTLVTLVEDVTSNKDVQAVRKYPVEEYNRLKGNKDNDRQLMFVKVEDVTTNKEVQAGGKYSIEEYNRLKGNKDNDGQLMFVKVVEAEKQVVSGMKYYLKIQAVNKTSGEVKVFEAVVVVKPWLRKKELVMFAPS